MSKLPALLDDENVSYHQIEPFLLSGTHDVNPPDDMDYVHPDLPPIEMYVI